MAEASASLRKAYPPAKNQHGRAHWPILRMVVLHELETGLAEVPQWGPMYGAKLAIPGRNMDTAFLHRMIVDEGVTAGPGVPTIWLSMLEHVQQTGQRMGRLNRLYSGGTAPPAAMMETYYRDYGDLLDGLPGAPQLRRIVRQRLPEVVDPVDAARLHDVVVDNFYLGARLRVLDNLHQCHRLCLLCRPS